MSRKPLVLKIGGSLTGRQPTKLCLDLAASSERRIVVVPGGGSFAGQVRTNQKRQKFSDADAHRLAILAMHETAAVYAVIQPAVHLVSDIAAIEAAWRDHHVPVWCPWPMVENAPDLPQDWSVTSDGLAAWLAERIPNADVALVKSCLIPVGATPQALAASGIVDPTFARIVMQHGLKWDLINGWDQNITATLSALLSA